MKKMIASLFLIASSLTFAGSTAVVWVRGGTEAQVENDLRMKVQEINSRGSVTINGQSCDNPRVYAASAPKKGYRVNRFGDLEVQWTATIKVSCSNND